MQLPCLASNSITFHTFYRILGSCSPFTILVHNIHLVTKEQKLWYKYIKHSKRPEWIIPSLYIHVFHLQYLLWNQGGNPLFAWKLQKARGRRRAALFGLLIGPRSPLLAEAPPRWNPSASNARATVRSSVPQSIARHGVRYTCSHIL